MPTNILPWFFRLSGIIIAVYLENLFFSFQQGQLLFRPSIVLFLALIRPPVKKHFVTSGLALMAGHLVSMTFLLAEAYILSDLVFLGSYYFFLTKKKTSFLVHKRKDLKSIVWIVGCVAIGGISLAITRQSQLSLSYIWATAISVVAHFNFLIIFDKKNLALLSSRSLAIAGIVLITLASLFFYLSLSIDAQTTSLLSFSFFLLTLIVTKYLGPSGISFAAIGFFAVAITQMAAVDKDRLWFFLLVALIANVLVGDLVMQNIELHEKKNLWSVETEKLKKLQTLFLANVSHELRTPLTAIIGYTEILLEKSKEFQTELKAMRQSEDTLLGILNSILSFSQTPLSGQTPLQEKFNAKDIFKEAESFFSPLAIQRQLNLKFTYGQEMSAVITSDKRALKEILSHLINNAFKFTKTGSITIFTEIRNSRLYFSVEDTGIGIPQERIKNIFSSFYQVNASMARAYGGLGLGLAICAKLVRQLGGNIDVNSQKNRGTRFNVDIPITISEADTITSRPNLIKPHTQILLVDDSPDNVDVMSLFLQQQEIDVTTAGNGKEAIDNVIQNEKKFDLILMDMQMPIMDGYQATKLLRQRGITTPIVAVTAHTAPGEKEKCLSVGCNDYLAKPFSKDSFLEKINLNISRPLHSH